MENPGEGATRSSQPDLIELTDQELDQGDEGPGHPHEQTCPEEQSPDAEGLGGLVPSCKEPLEIMEGGKSPGGHEGPPPTALISQPPVSIGLYGSRSWRGPRI